MGSSTNLPADSTENAELPDKDLKLRKARGQGQDTQQSKGKYKPTPKVTLTTKSLKVTATLFFYRHSNF